MTDLGQCHRIAKGDPSAVVDEVIEIVLTGCPECEAQDADPLGLYRPMMLIPRADTLTAECKSCGFTHAGRI